MSDHTTTPPPNRPATREAAFREALEIIADQLDVARSLARDGSAEVAQALHRFKAENAAAHEQTQTMLGELFSKLDALLMDRHTFERQIREEINAIKRSQANGHAPAQ